MGISMIPLWQPFKLTLSAQWPSFVRRKRQENIYLLCLTFEVGSLPLAKVPRLHAPPRPTALLYDHYARRQWQ